MHHLDANVTYGKKLDGHPQESLVLFWTNPSSNILKNNSCVITYLHSHNFSQQDEKDILVTDAEVRTNS